MDVTTNVIHDSEVLPRLLKGASINRDVIKAFMDGAYDTRGSYFILRRTGIRPVIKPRANARTDRGPPERRISAAVLKMFGGKGGVCLWATVKDGPQRQHSKDYTENTPCQET
jgi:hypothetical protein